jgi:hypothetical protein
MPSALQEFADANLHRVYPLDDAASGIDITSSFTLPTSLITDIFLCAPDIPSLDKTKFYIRNIIVRKFFIDILLGYDGVDEILGTFKNIDTTAPVHSTYDFVPSRIQSQDEFAPLFHMTGQIMIGEAAETLRFLGSWLFSYPSTQIIATRISLGVLNVQFIQINNRIFTGTIKLREGANVSLDVDTSTLPNGDLETVITISATLQQESELQLTNDADVLAALVAQFGTPILTVNGLFPDVSRNFTLLGEDCTTLTPIGNGLSISNPCATPCCDEDPNIASILENVSNLNLRYANLINFFNAQQASINDLQNKLLVLGSQI